MMLIDTLIRIVRSSLHRSILHCLLNPLLCFGRDDGSLLIEAFICEKASAVQLKYVGGKGYPHGVFCTITFFLI